MIAAVVNGFEHAEAIAVCIGCGCDDNHACMQPFDVETPAYAPLVNVLAGDPCAWLIVDRDAGVGVCTACPSYVDRWNAGVRRLSTLAVIKQQQFKRDEQT